MVIFKQRWAKQFLNDLRQLSSKALADRYFRQIPSNMLVQDVVDAATPEEYSSFFTKAHSSFFLPEDSQIKQASHEDDIYFFPIEESGRFITCLSERSHPYATVETTVIKVAFASYIDKYLFQLGARLKDARG